MVLVFLSGRTEELGAQCLRVGEDHISHDKQSHLPFLCLLGDRNVSAQLGQAVHFLLI